MYCHALKSVNIPFGVTSISLGVFDGCETLIEITLPESIKSISNGAFRGCVSLTHLSIPSSVMYIGPNAFEDCWALTSINIPLGIKAINMETFRNCRKLREITIPSSVTSLGNGIFQGCQNLEIIVIPPSIIGENAFEDCLKLNVILDNDHYPQRSLEELSAVKSISIRNCDRDYILLYCLMYYGERYEIDDPYLYQFIFDYVVTIELVEALMDAGININRIFFM
jgi:hypothetical protein